MKSIEFLKTEKCLDIVALLLSPKLTDENMMSVFERFCLLCDNARYLKRNLIYQELSRCMSDELDRPVELGDFSSREAQKAVWRALNGVEDVNLTYNVATADAPIAVKKIDESADVFDLLRNSKYEDSEELFDNVANYLQTNSLLLDLTGSDYCRPDPYHSCCTYKKLLNGEKCGRSETSALLCWSVCRILMRREIELCVKASSSTAEKIIKLLESRSLYPKLIFYIERSDDTELDTFVRLCLKAKGRNVFFACKENEVQSKLLYVLPSSRIFTIE